MPEFPGTTKPGAFSLRLRRVFSGIIVIIMEIDGRCFRCCLDVVEDSLIVFTRFAQLLGAGHYLHGVLFEGGSVDVITQEGSVSGLC
jgi:hypothetical protein